MYSLVQLQELPVLGDADRVGHVFAYEQRYAGCTDQAQRERAPPLADEIVFHALREHICRNYLVMDSIWAPPILFAGIKCIISIISCPDEEQVRSLGQFLSRHNSITRVEGYMRILR